MVLNASTLIPLAALLGFLVLIALVAQQSLRRRINLLFVWYTFTLMVWAFCFFMLYANIPLMSASFWSNILVVPVMFGAVAFFHFVRVFLRKSEPVSWLSLGYGLCLLFAIVAALGYAVEGGYHTPGTYHFDFGIATYIMTPIALAFVGAAIFNLVRAFVSTKDPFARNRVIYPLAGVLIAIPLTMTNFIPGWRWFPAGHMGNLIQACLLAYAILMYRLVDVSIVLRRGFVYSMLTAFVLGLFLVVAFIVQAAFHAQAGQSFWISAVVMAIIITAVFQPTYRYIQRRVDLLFQRETYEYRRTLLASSQKMSAVLDVDELAEWLVADLMWTMKAAKAGLFLLDKETQQYMPRALRGYDNSGVGRIHFKGDNPVVIRLAEGNSCLTAEDMDRIPQLRSLWKSERGQLGKLETEVLVPLKVKDTLIGVVVLGPKRSKERYSFDDLELLLTVANQAAVALENARLYEESQLRAERLKESEEKYRVLVEDMNDGYAVVRGDRVLFVNKRSAEVIGRPAEEIVGQSFWRVIAPESMETVKQLYEATMAGETAPETMEFTLTAEDGTRLPLEVRFKEILYEGKPAYSLIMRDVSARKKAEEEKERRSREMAALSAIASTVSRTLDLDELLNNTLDKVLELMGVEVGGILHLDASGRRLTLRSYRGISEQMAGDFVVIELDEEEVERARRWVEPTVDMARVLNEENRARVAAAIQKEGLQMFTMVPIRAKREPYGALAIGSHDRRELTPEEVHLLGSIANQIAVGIENARLYQGAKETAEQQAVMAEVTRILSSSLDISQVYQAFTAEIKKLIDFDQASINLVEGQSIKVLALSQDAPTGVEVGGTLPLRGSGTEWLVLNKKAHIEADLEKEHCFSSDDRLIAEGFRSTIRLPLIAKDRAFGTFNLRSRRPHAFGREELEVLEQIVGQLAIAIENATLFNTVKGHEEQLEKAYEELKAAHDYMVQSERLRALGEMAGGVAHDFNNILAIILGRTQLALEDTGDAMVKRSLDIIERTAVDGAKTVRRLQDFARVRVDRELERVDLNELVKGALLMVEPRRAERQVTGRVEIGISADLDKVPPVEGNPAELREALMNIMFNAMDAMPEGGKITVKSEQQDGWVVLSISDTGIGMSEEVKRRAFDPFFSTKGADGLGLGLSVTYGIITRHGGNIDVDTSPGRGSTFYIRLPVARGARRRVRANNNNAHAIKNARILLADDDPEVAEVLELMLGQLGHRVTVASSGQEALTAFSPGDYDMVITDLGMPDISGRDVARAIKDIEPQIPVLLVTGWGVQLDPREMKEMGIDGVIAKPFSKDTLSAQIATLQVAKQRRVGKHESAADSGR